MTTLPISNLQMVEEQDATGDVAQVFDNVKRGFGIPFVPNLEKALAASPSMLRGTWEAINHIFLQTSLPSSLASMILYAIASANRCQYCSAIHNVTCMSLGIEEDTLKALSSNVEGLTPRRVQAIVSFAVKCAMDPLNLTEGDYEAVREQGMSEEEITEIITLAALGNFLDTLADSIKIELDAPIAEALRG